MGDRGQVVPQWHKQLYEFQRIRCTICSTSPNTKETTPAGKGHACCRTCHVELRKLELQWQKKEFLAVQIGVTLAEMYSVRFTGTAGAAGLHNKGAERKGQLFHFT